METFNFPYHTFETINPESGVRVQMGGGYLFNAAPDSPDQRTFKLAFEGMKYYVDSLGEADETIEPTKNMKAISEFYRAHRMHVTFLYDHPVYGLLEVKFNKPLVEPKGKKGGSGVVEAFEIELLEIL